jgi:hypothetical protein
MSRSTTRHCDRCGQSILEGGAVVDVQAGNMVHQHHEPLDLCGGCSERFTDWMRTGKPHAAPGGAREFCKLSTKTSA